MGFLGVRGPTPILAPAGLALGALAANCKARSCDGADCFTRRRYWCRRSQANSCTMIRLRLITVVGAAFGEPYCAY